MSQNEVKERLTALIDSLPSNKAEMVLDFAAFLKERTAGSNDPLPVAASSDEVDIWERELAEAEAYWFNLPEKTRQSYLGKTVAVRKYAILDADNDLSCLRRRIVERHPDQVVLYIEADAEREPALVLRSPRLK